MEPVRTVAPRPSAWILLAITLTLGVAGVARGGSLVHIPGASRPADVLDPAVANRVLAWTSFPDHLLVFFDDPLPALPEAATVLAECPLDEIHVLASKHDDPEKRLPAGSGVLLRWNRHVVFRIDPIRKARLDQDPDFCVAVVPFPRGSPLVERFVSTTVLERPRAASDLVSRLDRDRYHETLVELVSFQTRYTMTENFDRAAARARIIMEGAGLSVRYQDFQVWNHPTRNVIGELEGTDPGGDLYILGGHLDSTSWQARTTAPGADDNASGSAGVLEIARALAGHRMRASVWFVLFSGEEQGLHGSRALVQSLVDTGGIARVKGVFNLDMIGYNKSSQLRMTVESEEFARPFVEAVAQAASQVTPVEVHTAWNAWGSDHVPFLEHQVPAVLTLEYEYDDNPNDHTPRDTLEHVNVDLAMGILRANAAALSALAGPVSPR